LIVTYAFRLVIRLWIRKVFAGPPIPPWAPAMKPSRRDLSPFRTIWHVPAAIFPTWFFWASTGSLDLWCFLTTHVENKVQEVPVIHGSQLTWPPLFFPFPFSTCQYRIPTPLSSFCTPTNQTTPHPPPLKQLFLCISFSCPSACMCSCISYVAHMRATCPVLRWAAVSAPFILSFVRRPPFLRS